MELFWCLVLYEIVLKSVKTISQDAPVHRMLINILANSVLQLIIFFLFWLFRFVCVQFLRLFFEVCFSYLPVYTLYIYIICPITHFRKSENFYWRKLISPFLIHNIYFFIKNFPVSFVLLDFIIQMFELYMTPFVLIIGNSIVQLETIVSK